MLQGMMKNTGAYAFGCDLKDKSTLEEIRTRFDNDVERFSRLEAGQKGVIDAALMLELVAQSAARRLRPGGRILDLGCGAGNFTLRILQEVHPLECHLADLSRPMLDRARERLRAAGVTNVFSYQGDLRHLDFAPESFDCILAAAVFHHLREEGDWAKVFALVHRWLKPSGSLYVADLVIFDAPDVQELMWSRFSRHLVSIEGDAFRDKVFAYVAKEDSPRSLPFQFEVMRRAGFAEYDVLHRNGVCACYYARKALAPQITAACQ
jgi:tRNA (cmo5U34)-methyltransferase